MRRYLILLFVGSAGYVAACPPLDLGPAVSPALAAFGLAFTKRPMGWAAWAAAYGAGVAFIFSGNFWIAEVNLFSLILMALFEGIFFPLFGLLFRVSVFNRTRPVPVWLALPVAWIAVEYLRSTFPLDGYPWLLCGYTLWHCTPLIQVADLTGVYGPGFFLALAARVLAAWLMAMEKRGEKSPTPRGGTLLVLALTAGMLVYGLIRPQTLEMEKGPLVAAIQANIPQEVKGSRNLTDVTYGKYLDATRRLFEEGEGPRPSLVIWPETVFPWPLGDGQPGDVWYRSGYGYTESMAKEDRFIRRALMEDLLGKSGAWFLTGVLGNRKKADGGVESRNGAFLYDPAGQRTAVYYKTLLVPGGEYLPFIDSVPFSETIKSYVRDAAGYLPDLDPGFGVQVMRFTVGGREYRFGVQICFENIYGDYCRRFIREGAEFLVNISNEGWFKTSSEFEQMLAMSVFRAIETRRTLFRSTNTGIACVIGPEGRVPCPSERIMKDGRDKAVEGVLLREVPLCRTSALYVQVGDLFAQGIMLAQIIFLLFLYLKTLWVTKASSKV